MKNKEKVYADFLKVVYQKVEVHRKDSIKSKITEIIITIPLQEDNDKDNKKYWKMKD